MPSTALPVATFPDFVTACRAEVASAIDGWLPSPPACPRVVAEAMRYAVGTRGKRVRPLLALASAEAVAALCHESAATQAAARRWALPAACAAELIHTQSLVHDDLPAMDDDVLRRGQPTVHVRYGEGLAILVGDGLLAEAFGLLAREPHDDGDPSLSVRKLRTIEAFGVAIGAAGMAGGQAVDLSLTGTCHGGAPVSLDLAGLTDMHRRKTGGLFRVAAAAGAIMAGGDARQVSAMADVASRIGLAFQIVDDVLDVEATGETLGKSAGKDRCAGKATFPALVGVERSRRMAIDAIAEGIALLETTRLDTPHLRSLAHGVVARLD